MNYRSTAYLNQLIRDKITIIPRDIDLVVGVPRSGMLPASMIALLLNKPLKSIKELGLNEVNVAFSTRNLDTSEEYKKILVVDDSCMTGKSILKARYYVETMLPPDTEAVYCCIFATEESKQYLDIYFEICEAPRMFEWNVMNHALIQVSCMDLDGVFCVDPTEEQNDDGPKYIEFIKNAKPLLPAPKYPIGAIVTSRLEKYRKETEEWLKKNGITYSQLVMLDVPDKETRQKLGLHAIFKAHIYNKVNGVLFVESDDGQAQYIANYTNRPVYCTGSNKFYNRDNSFDRYERVFAAGKDVEKKAYDALGMMYEFADNLPMVVGNVSEKEAVKFVTDYCDSLNMIFSDVIDFVKPDEGIACWLKEYTEALMDGTGNLGGLPETAASFNLSEPEYLIDTSIYSVVRAVAQRVTTKAWQEEKYKVERELTEKLIDTEKPEVEGFDEEIAFLKKQGEPVMYPYPETYAQADMDFEEDSIVVVIGAKEGMITPDVVSKAKEIFLIEKSMDRIETLKETIAPYEDKVHVITKLAGRSDDEHSVTLDALLQDYSDEKIYIKMDANGMELDILKSAVGTLLGNDCRLSCTSYYTQDAEEELGMLFDNLGYCHEPSDRYVLPLFGIETLHNGKYEHIKSPYFRRAFIKAWK